MNNLIFESVNKAQNYTENHRNNEMNHLVHRGVAFEEIDHDDDLENDPKIESCQHSILDLFVVPQHVLTKIQEKFSQKMKGLVN